MRHIIALFYISLLFLFISGCGNAVTGNAVKNEGIYENGIKAEAFFCPKYNCSRALAEFANNAQKSLHCAFYDLNLEDLIKAIAAKSHTADVKVVVFKENYDGQIKGPGVKAVGSRHYMHNKFCVSDSKIVLTGSTNPTNNDANLNNNNIIIINSNYLAQNYEDEFEELWNGAYSSGDTVGYNKINTDIGVIESYFCPEDCGISPNGGVSRVIGLIRNAKESVKVASFSFTHEGMSDEMVKADIKGINVSVLTESKQRNVQNSQYERMRDFGANIKIDGNKYTMHHKFIVIDSKIVVTGSPNFSFSGFNSNDENMLIIYNEDLALGFIKEFNRIFDEGEVV